MKKDGYMVWEICLAILFLVTAFGGASYLGAKAVDNYRADELKRECDAIDSALVVWAKNHRQVSAADVSIRTDADGNEYLAYATGGMFPKTLAELGTVSTEQGYFSEEIDLTKFSYATQTGSDGKMTYTLGVTMPNGYYYISPLSKK